VHRLVGRSSKDVQTTNAHLSGYWMFDLSAEGGFPGVRVSYDGSDTCFSPCVLLSM
jgi:hypothetical protein